MQIRKGTRTDQSGTKVERGKTRKALLGLESRLGALGWSPWVLGSHGRLGSIGIKQSNISYRKLAGGQWRKVGEGEPGVGSR